MQNVGVKIQQHRLRCRLSQEALAEKLGVTRQSVSKWELGQSLPEIDKIVDMSRLFNVTTDELLIASQTLNTENRQDETKKITFNFYMTENYKKELFRMEMKHCQSCCMPLETENVYGTNADGTPNNEYCHHCLQAGAFGNPNETMEEMIESCIPHVLEAHVWPNEETARTEMMKIFPTLKRWQTS